MNPRYEDFEEVVLPDLPPLRPHAGNWTQLPTPPAWHGVSAVAWLHSRTRAGVISTLTSSAREPRYLLAMSRNGNRRLSNQQCREVLMQFGVLRTAEEVDMPGADFVRNWIVPVEMPVDG